MMKTEVYDNLEDANRRIAELNNEIKTLKKRMSKYREDIRDLKCAVSNAEELAVAYRNGRW